MTSIKDLKSDHKNARKRTDRSAKLIAESLQRYGAARSIVIDEDNRILAGNGTIEGAKAAGIKNIRVIETDGTEIIAVKRTGLSEDEKIGLALADNRTSDLSDWDKDMLQQLSAEHDLTPWFDADDLAEILGEVEQLPAEGLTDADDVPEAPEEPVTKLGDLWVLGDHRLLCGDSTVITDVERLMAGGKADLLLTDPPYNVDITAKNEMLEKAGKARKDKATYGIKNDAMSDQDFRQFLRDVCITADSAMRPGAVFYIWHADSEGYNFRGACLDVGWKVRQCLVWVKSVFAIGRSDYHWKHEPCLYGWKDGAAHSWESDRKQTTVLNFDKPASSGLHPTMKPVDLFQYQMANSTKPGNIVLDSFGGSGTTMIAAERINRKARLMELDPRYCDVIIKRWEDFTGKKAILEEAPEAF
jgi:site-specific DNA-methyltransferase (adenine-specific)